MTAFQMHLIRNKNTTQQKSVFKYLLGILILYLHISVLVYKRELTTIVLQEIIYP